MMIPQVPIFSFEIFDDVRDAHFLWREVERRESVSSFFAF